MTEAVPVNIPRRAFVGDVHGCFDELCELLKRIGFNATASSEADRIDEVWFVGDLVNTGPKSDKVLDMVAGLIAQGRGGFVLGNHDDYLLRALNGEPTPSKRTRASLAQIDSGGAIDRPDAKALLQAAPLERTFDDGDLLLVHAAPVDPSVDASTRRHTALFGPTSDDRDARGKPLRINWPRDYAGKPFVIFGHSPHREPARFHRSICLDTGCVYGGTLTAWLPHEDRCVTVPARRAYAEGQVRATASNGPYL